MKTIGIIGKDSFIGSNLYDYLLSSNYNVIGTTHETLDITQDLSIKSFLEKNCCDVVILLAGSKNVKELEQNPEYAYKVNVEPVKSFIKHIQNEKFIYFSSDYVFDGNRGKYTNEDIPNPDTVYGQNKSKSEKLLKESSIDYSIIRTAGVLGDKSVFLRWLISSLKSENSLEMFSDSYFTPTCVSFLCEAVEKVIHDEEKKIYHVVQEKRFSRYELACLIKELLNSDCKLIPVEREYKDRSLIQDVFTQKVSEKCFETYLKEILCIK